MVRTTLMLHKYSKHCIHKASFNGTLVSALIPFFKPVNKKSPHPSAADFIFTQATTTLYHQVCIHQFYHDIHLHANTHQNTRCSLKLIWAELFLKLFYMALTLILFNSWTFHLRLLLSVSPATAITINLSSFSGL